MADPFNKSVHVPNTTTNKIFYMYCSGSLPFKTFLITFNSLLMVFSLIGNFLVVGVFYKNKSLRTVVHYFIMNMAVSDFIYPAVYFPYHIGITYFDGVWLIEGAFGNVICKLVRNASILSNIVSTFSMGAIAVDRFHAVVFPMKPALISQKICRLLIVLCWFVATALCSPFFYMFQLVPDDSRRSQCVLQWRSTSHRMVLTNVALIVYSCFTFGCALVLTVVYSSIVIRLYKQKSHLNLATQYIRRRAKTNRRIVWMLLTIVILFYLVWIQKIAINFKLFVFDDVTLPCVYIWFVYHAMLPLYTMVNPVLYYIFNESYRQGFKELLCSYCLCRCVIARSRNRVDNRRQMDYATEIPRK